MKFTEIAKHFNPAWFTAVTGTAVIPLVLSFLDFPPKEHLGMFFFLATLFLLGVWPAVFLRTAKGVASGKIFLPGH